MRLRYDTTVIDGTPMIVIPDAMPDKSVTEPMPPQYKILFINSAMNLEGLVNQYLSDGWRPQGGVMVWVVRGIENWAQAVVK